MSTKGLSLVGFMQDAAQGMAHLRGACVPADAADQAVLAAWTAAQGMLGAPVPNAGHPDIKPLEANYTDPVMQSWWVKEFFNSAWKGAELRLVEIKPLLAYQFTVDLERAKHHCDKLSQPPTIDELMPLCLPVSWPPETTQSSRYVNVGHQSIIVKSRSMNFRVINQGVFPTNQAHEVPIGIILGTALPIAHVVRLNGRCYLHNGFHRAVGAGMKGATHMPCVVRDVATAEEARIGVNTFPLSLLESPNPPTLAHFVEGRAYPVALRAMSRIVQVNWAEHVVPDE